MGGIEIGGAVTAFVCRLHLPILGSAKFKDKLLEKPLCEEEKVLGGGLEPPCLAAYAPQTYVSAISPPERASAKLNQERRKARRGDPKNNLEPGKTFC